MAVFKIDVIEDECLGHTVFRGSVPANELLPACWIDFHDLDRNPLGYQRPFDDGRSIAAAQYAEKDGQAFWPECILAIRSNEEVDEEEDKVFYKFDPVKDSGGKYGKLSVTYNGERTESIADATVPWRRAFSQVDCQHRLGNMANSPKNVTVCIFPELQRREEAIIFKTINDKQKRVSTSLVDAIIHLTDTSHPDYLYIKWAFDLGNDPGSCLNRRVATGGRNLEPPQRLVTLRTLQQCARFIIPRRALSRGASDIGYEFLRSYWNVVRDSWPTEFEDSRSYKLITVPGFKALARYGRRVFEECFETQDTRQTSIERALRIDPSKVDWSNTGPLREASGNAGVRIIQEALNAARV